MPENLIGPKTNVPEIEIPEIPKTPVYTFREVWSNPNTNNHFAAQTLSLNLSRYDAIYVVIKGAADRTSYGGGIIFKGVPYDVMITMIDGLDGQYIFGRRFRMTNSSVVISIGTHAAVDNGAHANRNDLAIPVKIYGISFCKA